jgi:hypothetical protein
MERFAFPLKPTRNSSLRHEWGQSRHHYCPLGGGAMKCCMRVFNDNVAERAKRCTYIVFPVVEQDEKKEKLSESS